MTWRLKVQGLVALMILAAMALAAGANWIEEFNGLDFLTN